MITGDFESVWPRVFAETVAWLRSRGFDRHAAEDAAQEAGARALDRRIPFSSADDLTPWIRVVARRLARDANRKTARIGDDSADPVEREDVATVVEWRLALAAAAEAFVRLSATDQEAIIEGVVGEQCPDRRQAVRLAVRRHRARNRLLALLEGGVPVVLVWGRRLKRAAVPLALAAGIVPVLLAIPHSEGIDPSATPTITEKTVRSVQPAAAPRVGPESRRLAGHGPTDADSRQATTTTVATTVAVPVPGADGVARPGDGFIRPKRDHDPLVCAGTPSTGTVCIQSPLDH